MVTHRAGIPALRWSPIAVLTTVPNSQVNYHLDFFSAYCKP